jgi:kumamolisin
MSGFVELKGSERSIPQGAQDRGKVEDGTQLSVTVYLRSDPATNPPFDVVEEAAKRPSERRYLSADEATTAFGAANDEIDMVKTFAASHGLAVLRVNQAARSVKLGGTAAALSSAFGVELHRYALGDITYHSHANTVQLPAELAPIVQTVVGLDNKPLGRKFLRLTDDEAQAAIHAHRDGSKLPPNTFLPPQVAELYGFPPGDASGQTIAIFAFNGPMGDGGPSSPGGYEPAILEQYFTNVLGLPMPEIADVTIQGPGNDPGDGTNPNDASPEVYLDLSIVGALATGAKVVVYFTEFNEQGWVDALSEASTDTTHNPSVISISYGNPESGRGSAWTATAVHEVNLTLEAAAARGLTVTCAAGDSGATDGLGNEAHVDFPASSPWVLGCGGTRLEASNGSISKEVVWNDQSQDPEENHGATGGGVSVLVGLPSWQADAGVPPVAGSTDHGRGVPDVSSLADPETPFVVAQPGPHGLGGVGGTSAAAPLWASLLLRLNAALGKPVGFLNPVLYKLPSETLRDITVGDNKMPPDGVGYAAGPGWDACTGLGSPDGSALLAAL